MSKREKAEMIYKVFVAVLPHWDIDFDEEDILESIKHDPAGLAEELHSLDDPRAEMMAAVL